MNFYNKNTKLQVLLLYSRIIRLSKTWIAKEPENTCKEREYILLEARNEFRRNLFETDQSKINQLLILLFIMESHIVDQNICHPQLPMILTLKQKLLNKEKQKSQNGMISTTFPPLLSNNLEPSLIKQILPFLRSFFSEVFIKEDEIEAFALAIKENKDLDSLIFNSPARIVFPGRKSALKNLCKMTIKKFEQLKIDPSDVLYENLWLSCWQASFALADFLFLSLSSTSSNLLPSLFNSKCILELGSGCGLVGISLAKQLIKENKEIKIILSDSDSLVIEQLKENVKLNFGKDLNNRFNIEVKYLDWTNFIPKDLPSADIIIASDIIYDPIILPQLVQLLHYLLLNNQNSFPIIIIACTIRNQTTLEYFLKLIVSYKIQIKNHWKLCALS
ncbi:EF-hand domain-containing protein [Meloidogyne graminicola]|uniref:EF-hand domain-containing protein n=1 Tax=Meloidogyne graminicola TaxID=189291 RepID=A0A8S9ZSH8_9BILA|nr:EF-hand domain-containing protein [Meloidogyne graminicola]